jgi:hypothetical protein
VIVLAPETEEGRAALAAKLKELRTAAEAAFKKKCAAIEAAFNQLSILPATENGIPYKELIPGIARELMLMRSGSVQTQKQAKKSLQETAALMTKTLKALDSLAPEDTATWVTTCNLKPDALRQFRLMLRILPVGARVVEAKAPVVKRGRPRKIQAREIAQRVGERYYALTGKEPTVPSKGGAYGEYHALLDTVFKALDMVEDSAEGRGRAIQADWGAREKSSRNDD